MRFYIFLILLIIFNGCGRDTALVQTPQDLQKYVKINNKIIAFSQSCDENKDEAIQKARYNFSLSILSQINSKYEQNILNNSKTTKYHIIEQTKYNNLIGVKYYYEPIFKKNNKIIYCVAVYYDYDYFNSFKTYFDNMIIKLNNLIETINSQNYKDKQKEYLMIKKDILFYSNFYIQWTKKYLLQNQINLSLIKELDDRFNKKIIKIQNEIINNKIVELNTIIETINIQNYLNYQKKYIEKKKELLLFLNTTNNPIPKIITLLDIELRKKIKTIKQQIFYNNDKKLKFYIQEFKNILKENQIVSNKTERKKIISKLLNIKQKSINIIKKYPKKFKNENRYFDRYTKINLYKYIKIKPICKFIFENNKFLQNKYYKIFNKSYDIDLKHISSKLYVDNDIILQNKPYGWKFKSKSSGYKIFKLVVTSDNGLKSSCKKEIKILPYDIRIEYFYKDMDISKFKDYVKEKYNGVKKEYPNSFFKSLLDSRKAYYFGNYYALFVKDKLKCIIDKKYFNEKKLSCKYYKNKIKLTKR